MRKEKEHQELEQIRAQHGGLLKPEHVVEFARDPNTALHAHFTWDDADAAQERRLDQARNVIRLCVVIVQEPPIQVPAYVSLPTDRQVKNGYRSIKDVITDESLRAELLRDVLERLSALKRKYNNLQELAQVWGAIEQATQTAEQQASSATG